MAVVYANQTASVSWSGGKTLLKKDQAWDADAGLVRERPELFSDEPEKVAGRASGRPPVERATRAPGEMRAVPAKRAPKKPEPAGD
jgi:hypothetical protein